MFKSCFTDVETDICPEILFTYKAVQSKMSNEVKLKDDFTL